MNTNPAGRTQFPNQSSSGSSSSSSSSTSSNIGHRGTEAHFEDEASIKLTANAIFQQNSQAASKTKTLGISGESKPYTTSSRCQLGNKTVKKDDGSIQKTYVDVDSIAKKAGIEPGMVREAARQGEDALKSLIATGLTKQLQMQKKEKEERQIAFLSAAQKGDISTLKELLKLGLDVNVFDKDGWTPLHNAIAHGEVKTVSFLLQAGANPKLKSIPEPGFPYQAKTPFELAEINLHASDGDLKTKYSDICALLEDPQDTKVSVKTKALFSAVEEGKTSAIKKALEEGADINAFNSRGWTPLHSATMRGDLETVRFVLGAGATSDIKTVSNRFESEAKTAYQLAIGLLCSKLGSYFGGTYDPATNKYPTIKDLEMIPKSEVKGLVKSLLEICTLLQSPRT